MEKDKTLYIMVLVTESAAQLGLMISVVVRYLCHYTALGQFSPSFV